MKSALVITTAVASAFLTGCAGNSKAKTENAQICADSNGIRAEDENCDNRRNPRVAGFYAWYYISRGGKVPAMGDKISGGSFSPKAGQKYVKSGSAERGGFGSTTGGSKTVVVAS